MTADSVGELSWHGSEEQFADGAAALRVWLLQGGQAVGAVSDPVFDRRRYQSQFFLPKLIVTS